MREALDRLMCKPSEPRCHLAEAEAENMVELYLGPMIKALLSGDETRKAFGNRLITYAKRKQQQQLNDTWYRHSHHNLCNKVLLLSSHKGDFQCTRLSDPQMCTPQLLAAEPKHLARWAKAMAMLPAARKGLLEYT